MLALTPLPTLPLFTLSAVVGGIAAKFKDEQEGRRGEAQGRQKADAQAARADRAGHDRRRLELEVGYALVKLVDTAQGGDQLERVSNGRRQLATELGLVMPPVSIKDNVQLPPNEYRLKIRGNTVAIGKAYPGQFFAVDNGLASPEEDGQLNGIASKDPAFGLPAWWIEPGQRQQAEAYYIVVEPSMVVTTHLMESSRITPTRCSREETNNLITNSAKAKALRRGARQGARPIRHCFGRASCRRFCRTCYASVCRHAIWKPSSKPSATGARVPRTWMFLPNMSATRASNDLCPLHRAGTGRPLAAPETAKMVDKLCVSLDPAIEDQINSFIQRSAKAQV